MHWRPQILIQCINIDVLLQQELNHAHITIGGGNVQL